MKMSGSNLKLVLISISLFFGSSLVIAQSTNSLQKALCPAMLNS